MKIGTRILIKKTARGCAGAERCKGVVTEKQCTDGLLDADPGYNVELDNGEIWRINVDAEVEILNNEFGKHLLKDGRVVKRNNGTFAIVIGNQTYSRMGHCLLTQYNDNLNCHCCMDNTLDIIAIYEPSGQGDINDILDGKYLNLIAEHPVEVREMTLTEICKELGYNVKIVKED